MHPLNVLIGCEQFGEMREAFRRLGHNAYSCDVEPARDGSKYHIRDNVLNVLKPRRWDFAIFHPDCTFMTNSSAWALQDPDFVRYPGVGYHQQVRESTLTGKARRKAQKETLAFVLALKNAPIPYIVIENPRGALSTLWRQPDQSVQPNWFGHDASKETCFWYEGQRFMPRLPHLQPTRLILPRFVDGQPRWANQSDGGFNRLSPDDDRAMQRAATYPGIAKACATQWGGFVSRELYG